MASLTGQTVASTYPTLLKLDNVPLTSVYKVVEIGTGDDTALQLSTGGVKSSGALDVTGNAAVGGTLGVTGATTLAATAVGGTLGVTNATTLSSTLGVTGAATLSSTANIVGAATCQSTLSVTGAVSALGALTVTGVTTANGGVVGSVTGNTAGTHTGPVVGAVTGNTAGTHTGPVVGAVTGDTAGTHTGPVVGSATGSSGSCTGNAATATALQTGRDIILTGAVTGTASLFNGTANATIATTLTTPVTALAVSDQSNASTGYFDLPSGTEGQRPGVGVVSSGNIRYNTTIGVLEYYNGTGWVAAGPNAWVTFNGAGVLDKSGTYTQVGTTVTANVPGHTLLAGHSFFMTSTTLVDDTYVVATSPAPTTDQFTFTAPVRTAGTFDIVVKLRSILAFRGVSSVSRSAAGEFIVNMTVPMPNANYPICLSSSSRQTSNYTGDFAVNASSFKILTENSNGDDEDASRVSATVFS